MVLDLCKNLVRSSVTDQGQKTHPHLWKIWCLFLVLASVWKRYQSVTQSLWTPDNSTCLLVLQCSVFSRRSLMVATAGWHCKQPSHLSVNGRADVSTTESLPPSCSYMKPQQHPSLPLLPLQREALSPAQSLQQSVWEKCTSFERELEAKPGLDRH